jgi:hypothetical protein
MHFLICMNSLMRYYHRMRSAPNRACVFYSADWQNALELQWKIINMHFMEKNNENID